MTETLARLDKVTARLREQGHRLTPQRMAVIKTLVGSEEHLSAEQIHERVKADFPMTSLATIYKTVAVLKEMGEILELGFSDGGNRYEGKPHPHPHLVCIRCKKISDVEVAALDALPQQVAQSTGYRIVGHRFDFFGLCPQCQKDE
jgi:Fur family peroxide stress response transcriptional regulator